MLLLKLLMPILFSGTSLLQRQPLHMAGYPGTGIQTRFSPMPRGRYVVRLLDAKGIAYRVHIFAPQEKVEVDRDARTEFEGKGAKYFTGTYRVALRREGERKYLVERIALFGSEITPSTEGMFTPWHKRVFVLRAKARPLPDLLLITQYGTSNGDEVRAFFVSKGVLVPVTWHIASKHADISQFVNGGQSLKCLHGNLYQTSFFSNDVEDYGTHIRTWRFDPRACQFSLLRDVRTAFLW